MGDTGSPTPETVVAPPYGVAMKDAGVSLAGVHPTLLHFLVDIGVVHKAMWEIPVVVTSGKDGTHGKGSKHYVGEAVDLRISDKVGRDQFAFICVLISLSDRYKLAIFDESNLPGAGHVHVEIAG